MAFQIPRAQQKVFIENFMEQVLDHALILTARGKDRKGPGETIQAIGRQVIAELKRTAEATEGTDS